MMPIETSTRREWKATGPIAVGAVALMVLVGVAGAWGMTASIAGAVVAPGAIKVESERQVIQHPQGGVVGEILGRNGMSVEAGEIVVRLDDTLVRSELAIIEGKLFEILARRARLEAERDGAKKVNTPEELRELAASDSSVTDFIEGQKRLFAARLTTLAQQKEQIDEQIAQVFNQIDGTNAQLAALAERQSISQEELAINESLLEKGLVRKPVVTQLRREGAEVAGELGRLNAKVAELNGHIANLKTQKLRLDTQRRQDAISMLRDLHDDEIELSERRLALQERLRRLDIRAPMSGIIYGSQVFAVQSVIEAAQPLMYIVPQDRGLVISTQVDAIHIDQVHVGQAASLRFTAFDQRSTPQIDGEVLRISADALVNEVTGESYYEVELLPDEIDLANLGDHFLLPGMPVEAFIQTDERTPVNYLVKPLADYFHRAFRES